MDWPSFEARACGGRLRLALGWMAPACYSLFIGAACCPLVMAVALAIRESPSALPVRRISTATPTYQWYPGPGSVPTIGAKRLPNGGETHVRTHVVPVFTFGDHNQMTLILIERLLGGSSVLTGDGDVQRVHLDIKTMRSMTPKIIDAAFTQVNTQRPLIALWMFDYHNGDPWFSKQNRSSLRLLARHFKVSSVKAGVRHGVFHWPPEACAWKGVTFGATQAAYQYVDFVFMFANMDERLASLNKTKYLPFPLGPALWRQWQKPATLRPTLMRPLIAAYRGSASTRVGELQRMMESLHVLGEKKKRKIILEERTNWSRNDSHEDHERYVHLLTTARYAVAPPGIVPNTYRIAEACESGSVPVIIPQYSSGCYWNWAALYGYPQAGGTSYDWIPKAPFLVLDDWASLGQKLKERLVAERDEVADLLSWYEDWLKAFRNKLFERIHAVGEMKGPGAQPIRRLEQ